MNFYRLVPRDSFLGRYLAYMRHQETALPFDWWCGLWCLSTACARYVYVNRPRAPVYLNTFVVLVGESGRPRKTASVHTATTLVRHVVGGASDVGLIDAKVTPEKLDGILHDRTMDHGDAQLCIAIPELAVFLGTERYIAAMPVLLTDLYDCPRIRHGGGTIARGEVLQRDVWISFLSASTPIWLLKSVNPNVIEGGFTSRCYFIVANERKQSIPWPKVGDPTLWDDLCSDIKIIAAEARGRGPIDIDDTALAVFARWYDSREHSADPFRQSFEAREDAHVLRIAALLCVNDGSWRIKRGHVRIAIRIIGEVADSAGQIFEHAEQRTKYAMAFDTVRSELVSTGMDPIPRSRLYVKVRHHLPREDFQLLIDIMHELGTIQRFSVPAERGPPTEYIRGTRLLLAKGLGEQVLEKFI